MYSDSNSFRNGRQWLTGNLRTDRHRGNDSESMIRWVQNLRSKRAIMPGDLI